MQQFVIDIETSGTPFEEMDEETQQYLLKRADTPEKIQEVKERLNLWALTGEIVTIGVFDVASKSGTAFFQAPGKEIAAFDEDNFHYEPGTEQECLERFWKMIAKADRVITFNGRAFDMPWLLTRSLVRGVRATRNIMPPRYSTSFHVDLADLLAFYGATRHYALSFWCKMLNIESSKGDISGAEVPEAYRRGEYERIARYCMQDVRATAELFERWYVAIGQL
ncbi:MAG: ribonuclease H-like domain-containing protein [Candidatus Uhrbacteria bacterium]